MQKGKYLVISGPSGVGKDTIAEKLPGWISVSATSRLPRGAEKEGVEYFFHSREEFEKMITEGELLEYCCYQGNYYGTPVTPPSEHYSRGETVIFVIEINGARAIKKRFPEAVTVFLEPPSMAELERRLSGRNTESPEKIRGRLAQAASEVKIGREEYDYVVTNYVVEDTVNKILNIIHTEE